MQPLAYCLFDTPLGECGLAWRVSGAANNQPAVIAFQLPEAKPEITESKLAEYCGVNHVSSPTPEIATLIGKVCRHFAGQLQDFQDIALDLTGSGTFAQQVYTYVRKIPAGQTRTYGEVARAVQRAASARAVGQALGRNPITLLIPCHRILGAGGKLTGFSAHGGVGMKLRLLALEGVVLTPNRTPF